MKMLDLLVLESALEWLQKGQRIWLATVLHTYGSAPRSPGSLFVANGQGQYYGSLSGGCIEEDFLLKIHDNWFTEKSEIVTYGELSKDFRPNIALPCGGTIDLLIESIPATTESIAYISAMLDAFRKGTTILKTVTLGESALITEHTCAGSHPFLECNGDTLTISIESYTTIFIAGISPVALYCIDFADKLGFSVIVTDDREEEIRQFQAASYSERVSLLNIFPAQYLETHTISSKTAILSLTHDPRIDDLTMLAALETPAFYIGAMGSTKNSQNRFKRLKEVSDFSDQVLTRIHAPIGLSIGSKTPAEIALSIMADVVKCKNGL